MIPQNICKLHAKKIHTKYDETCVCEKNPHQNYPHKKKSWIKLSGISSLFKKIMPWLAWVYIGSSFIYIVGSSFIGSSFYHKNGKLMQHSL